MAQAMPDIQFATALLLQESTRAALWRRVMEAIEGYLSDVTTLPITANFDSQQVRSPIEGINFDNPLTPQQAVEFALTTLRQHQTHTPHPGYFGLYDPAPTTMGVIAETLVAAFNPQLAVWMQSPAAIEIEQSLVTAFGEKFGYRREEVDGTFTSGGAEANHTAILTALAHQFSEFLQKGVRSLGAQPVLYISAEGHHSVWKAAKLCGLGSDSVREIEVDGNLRMDMAKLAQQITEDRKNGHLPFMIIATAGTTSAGAIDLLPEIAEFASRENLWLHVDAAWGGAVALVPELRHLLIGIERADSITFDPHKWLSVPRGAGLYLTRHPDILGKTFHVSAPYVPPRSTSATAVTDPFSHSMQWSRRFLGLKLFLSLAVAGWKGYADLIQHQINISNYLCGKLEESDWAVINDPSLAVVCFVDRNNPQGSPNNYLQAIREDVIRSGQAWVSCTRLASRMTAIRACIVNYRTSRRDIDVLLQTLNQAREKITATFQ